MLGQVSSRPLFFPEVWRQGQATGTHKWPLLQHRNVFTVNTGSGSIFAGPDWITALEGSRTDEGGDSHWVIAMRGGVSQGLMQLGRADALRELHHHWGAVLWL